MRFRYREDLQPILIGALFIGAGTMHFARPDFYLAIMPPWIPHQHELVAASGVAEILGGIGVIPRRTRAAAAWGLVVLLLAVFPANVHMALASEKFAAVAPRWALYARLPLQFVLIAWIYAACIKRR